MLSYFPILLFLVPVAEMKYYTLYDLEESTNLCEDLHRKPLKFGVGIESAIRLSLKGKKSFHCQFEISTFSEKHGIVAVIQEMNFRMEPDTGACIDYIMFKGSKFGGASRKYCGNFNVETAMEKYVYQGNTYIAMSATNAYQNDADDGVIVIIHMNMNDYYYEAGAELVLTSYTDCNDDAPLFYKPCVTDNLDTICIEDVYFGDGFVNCPFRGCVDEGTCVPLLVKYYGKRVFVGTLVSVCLSICLSAACFYVCTPFNNYDEEVPPPENYMLPPLDEESEGGTDDEERERDGNASEGSVESWDKPPMYESLFPIDSPFAQA